jgi:hypothetical protein
MEGITMLDLLHNQSFVMWTAIILICIIPPVAHYWWKIRSAEIEANLKHDMLQRGMSAEEIQMVLAASGKGSKRNCSRVAD